MSLFEELIEDITGDKKILKSFCMKDSLSDQIFENDNKMRDDVRQSLLKIADEFIESLGIEFFIHDIILTGSLANYNWSSYSDVDLHILIDYEDSKFNPDLLKEFFDAKKNIWNEKHKIKVKGYDVEIYVQDVQEPHISSGVYSILNNEWLVEPSKKKVQIDDKKILQKAETFMTKVNELQNLKYSKEVLDKIEAIRKKLKEFRQSGLDSGGEFSYENLVFKLLRRNGTIEKLLKLKTKLTDKKLSVA
jgi:Nucleotidyltransferase domain